jgi:pimeloyl-ACP methyl ester carboxylesterase
MRHGVILLPGIITPAELAYGGLRDELRHADDAVLQDLAVYAHATPPRGYSLDTEIAAVLDTADQRGFERFHLVGYSAGGAIAAAFAARHPQRLVSLGLLEPAWLGNSGMSAEEISVRRDLAAAVDLPPEQALPAFTRLNLAPGVAPPPPPPGPPPEWMAKRPSGIKAVNAAFEVSELDRTALSAFARPVLYVLGAKSNPALYDPGRARNLFADFTLEVFEDRHHFDPPHRAEPKRLAQLLKVFWTRAEAL